VLICVTVDRGYNLQLIRVTEALASATTRHAEGSAGPGVRSPPLKGGQARRHSRDPWYLIKEPERSAGV